MRKNIIKYCVIGAATMIMTIAVMTSNSATAQLYDIGRVIYQSPTLLVISGDVNLNSTWALVDQGKQEGYKMNGMSAYTYQTGDATIGYTVYRDMVVTMSK